MFGVANPVQKIPFPPTGIGSPGTWPVPFEEFMHPFKVTRLSRILGQAHVIDINLVFGLIALFTFSTSHASTVVTSTPSIRNVPNRLLVFPNT